MEGLVRAIYKFDGESGDEILIGYEDKEGNTVDSKYGEKGIYIEGEFAPSIDSRSDFFKKQDEEDERLVYLLDNDIIFIEEEWDEETGECWLAYYEDEDLTKRINNINDYVENHNAKEE